MGIVSKDLADVTLGLKVAEGQVQNVLEAAVRDVGEATLEHFRGSWPVDTGLSLSTWRFTQTGLDGVISNDTDYTSFVHHGLADRLWDEAQAAINKDVVALLSERVTSLLVNNGR